MSQADRLKWNDRYADDAAAPTEVSRVLADLSCYLPPAGTALDVAGGAGRNAIWLARRNLDTTLWDISKHGLEIAARRGAAAGVRLGLAEVDLDEVSQLPATKFDLVLCVCYLNRTFLARVHKWLNPGGTLMVIHPTQRNLERHAKPPRDFLLQEGELPTLTLQLAVHHFEEGWLSDGRHDAVLVAKAPERPAD